MAPGHSQRKTQPQTTVKQTLSPKKALCKKTVSPKKQLELKQVKQEQKKMAMKLHIMKEPEQPSAQPKMPQQQPQKQAPLSMKGSGNTSSLGKNLNNKLSSQAKVAKLGRNLCTLTCEDLQQELNEMMCKRIMMCRRVFANNPRVPH